MDNMRDSISWMKKKLKRPLKGSARKSGRQGAGTDGEISSRTSSPGPSAAADGVEGNKAIADAVLPSQQERDKAEPVPVGGSDNPKIETESGKKGVTQAGIQSQPSPILEAAVKGRPSGEIRPANRPSGLSISHDGKPDDKADTTAIPDHALEVPGPKEGTEPGISPGEKKSNWKLAASTAKLFLRGVRDSADAFGPLKSVASGLCFILENCERTKANKQSIESLVPRIEELNKLLCAPVPENDTNERERRKRLERKFKSALQELEPLREQGIVEGFFTNVENEDMLRGLVEDLRDAMIEYQTSLQQDIYNKSCQLIESVDLILLDRMCHTKDAGYLCGK